MVYPVIFNIQKKNKIKVADKAVVPLFNSFFFIICFHFSILKYKQMLKRIKFQIESILYSYSSYLMKLQN